MNVLVVAFAVVAVGSWVIGVVGTIGMFRHRDRGRPASWYLMRGHAFLTGEHFTIDARRWHRLVVGGALTFVLSLLVFGIAGAIVTAWR